MAPKKVMLSAIKPSNRLTLGNYIGAMKNWVESQKDYNCLFFIVDLHAITVRQDPKLLAENSYHALAEFLASGMSLDHCTFFVQSHVHEHAELAWALNCFTYMGELNRMTQFKDKSSQEGKNIGAGLFNYPCLMAADILLYQTDLVPVGADQKQHIELTRDVAQRTNNFFKSEVFKIPEPFIPKIGARVMDLQDPTRKMSKSDTNAKGTVLISDSDKQMEKKIKSAVTDSGSEIEYSDEKPGIQNLLTIQSSLNGTSIPDLEAQYKGKQYGHLKADTAEIVVASLAPIRKKAEEYYSDRAELDRIFKKCADQAREIARKTLANFYEKVGFIAKT